MSMILGQHMWLLKHTPHLFIRKYVSNHHVAISVDGRILLPYGILKFDWRHPDVLRFNIKMIKQLTSDTSYFIVCEAT